MPLGKDLAYIRKSQNLSLEDIQNATKIPVSTLKSIEDESIFYENAENITYRRSFVRSYAKVLKIDDQEIVKALNAMEEGTYKNDLLSDEAEAVDETSETSVPAAREEEPEEVVKEDKTEPQKPLPTKKAEPAAPQSNEDINWADMGRKFSPTGKNSRMWMVLSIALVVIILVGVGFYFYEDIGANFGSPSTPAEELISESEPADAPPAPIDSANMIQNMEEAEADQTSPEEPASENMPITLGDTLTVAVYAAYGQLEPVRVTSDLNWRTNPYWMEEGEAYNFDFNDTLLVRGQYSRMLLLFNGHPIENPRQNHFDPSYNSVVITRSILNQPQYLNPPPQEFPLEVGAPDTIIYRIRF